MTHDMILSLIETYVTENEKFEGGNKSAGTRARKALSEVTKLARVRRQEIQDKKNNDK
tara:strand:+ start:372 stop:545 length:174 start_codon:yes stop_codon:yes gene_type:complete